MQLMLTAYFNCCYPCAQIFRNEGVSSRHNPEFTSVEIYQAYADYNDMMDLTEALLRTAAEAVCCQQQITYQGVDIDLSQPFKRVSMNQLVQDATGVWTRYLTVMRNNCHHYMPPSGHLTCNVASLRAWLYVVC